jgi:hypothetical protein
MIAFTIEPSEIRQGSEAELCASLHIQGDKTAYHVKARFVVPDSLAHLGGSTSISSRRADPGSRLKTTFRVRARFAGTPLNDLSAEMKSVEVEPALEKTSGDARPDLRRRRYTVFISYASLNRRNAFRACQWIEASGIRCWIAPRDIPPGEDWKPRLVDIIGQAKIVVLIYSQAAQQSKQVRTEVDLAFEEDRMIIPFRVQAVDPDALFRYCMASRQWIDAIHPPMEPHYKRLVAAVHRAVQT